MITTTCLSTLPDDVLLHALLTLGPTRSWARALGCASRAWAIRLAGSDRLCARVHLRGFRFEAWDDLEADAVDAVGGAGSAEGVATGACDVGDANTAADVGGTGTDDGNAADDAGADRATDATCTTNAAATAAAILGAEMRASDWAGAPRCQYRLGRQDPLMARRHKGS